MNLVHNDLNVTRLPISPRPHFPIKRILNILKTRKNQVFFLFFIKKIVLNTAKDLFKKKELGKKSSFLSFIKEN